VKEFAPSRKRERHASITYPCGQSLVEVALNVYAVSQVILAIRFTQTFYSSIAQAEDAVIFKDSFL
jgi:hypothetical protein